MNSCACLAPRLPLDQLAIGGKDKPFFDGAAGGCIDVQQDGKQCRLPANIRNSGGNAHCYSSTGFVAPRTDSILVYYLAQSINFSAAGNNRHIRTSSG
jgi:hypothetical protein